jgi:hypothetical protein
VIHNYGKRQEAEAQVQELRRKTLCEAWGQKGEVPALRRNRVPLSRLIKARPRFDRWLASATGHDCCEDEVGERNTEYPRWHAPLGGQVARGQQSRPTRRFPPG